MSRTVTKSIASATVYVLDPSKDFEIDANGMPVANVTFELDGNPSPNRARIQAEKVCKSKNVMVLNIEVDETKIKVDPAIFMAHSEVCKPDTAYGREYVTQTFKITNVKGFYMDVESGLTNFEFEYMGVTTDSKLLKAARDKYGMQAVVTVKNVIEERRYMTRDKYLALASGELLENAE